LDLRGLTVPFDVASNPEFLKEGAAVADFMNPDRIILGIESENARKILDRLYQPFLLSGRPIIHMDIISAELTKYAANCMLATKISFMNELANLCDIVNADINNVRLGIGSDPRIGNSFINAGVGFGGSCFPKDLRALIKTANDCGYSLEIIKAAERVNQMQKEVLFNKINAHFKGDLTRKTFALWGLSFKPDTDDIREASSLRIIEQLSNAGAQIRAYDPIAMKIAKKMLSQPIEYCNNMYEALHDASGMLLVTEWSEFRIPDFALMAQIMKERIIFDGRNIYNPSELEEFGFTYYGIGRRKGSLAS
jgi:UDPglucose 6-dehydrogenase